MWRNERELWMTPWITSDRSAILQTPASGLFAGSGVVVGWRAVWRGRQAASPNEVRRSRSRGPVRYVVLNGRTQNRASTQRATRERPNSMLNRPYQPRRMAPRLLR